MPFSCILPDNILYSEAISASQWEDLKLKVIRGEISIKLPCCDARVSFRSGPSRRQHFAHFPGENCKSDGWSDYSGSRIRHKGRSESLDHNRVKEIIREVAERVGWTAQTEYAGTTPSGQRWIADTLLERDGFKLAIEIQVSPQSFSDYRIRQQRYRESGIKCIWLSCFPSLFSDEEIPVFELSKSKGVYVIDFPKFLEAPWLKLPADFTGASLGEFIQAFLLSGVVWWQEWISKNDQLASMTDWERCRLFIIKAKRLITPDSLDTSSVFTHVKEKTEPKPTAASKAEHKTEQITLGNIKLPPDYNSRCHGLLLLFISIEGEIVDYWFRGDVETCKILIRLELSKYPNGTFAEVRRGLSANVIYRH